ncbi:MAG: hypothetical protein R2769_01255 [Saprospiraceae bacterium]
MNKLEDLIMQQKFDDEGDFMPLLSLDEELESAEGDILPETLPVLAVKNTVLFPGCNSYYRWKRQIHQSNQCSLHRKQNGCRSFSEGHQN